VNQKRCQDPVSELLSWYLNGSLDDERETAVRVHLETCAICADDLSGLSELAAGFEEHGVPGSRVRRKSPPTAVLAAAAVFVMVLAGLFWVYRDAPSPGQVSPPGPPRVVELDLGAGPTRSGEGSPTFEIPDTATEASIVLLVPDVGLRYRVELELPDGSTHAQGELAVEIGRGLGTSLVSADRLRTPGSYTLLLTGTAADGGIRRYSYTFEID